MGLIFALSSRGTVPNPPGWSPQVVSIVGHFGVYAVLAGLLWWGLGELEIMNRRRFVLALILAVLYGVSDEWHQSFVPGRRPDVINVIVDAFGAACGLLAIELASRRGPWLAASSRATPNEGNT